MKKRILVIEDLPMWQTILRSALEEEGYKVDIVNKLGEAMQKIKEKNYHFITVDMNLHDEDEDFDPENLEGWPILNYIDRTGLKHKTPIMVITALAEDDEVVKGLKKLKFIPVLLKREYKKRKFLETVKRYIDNANVTFVDEDDN